MSFIANLSISKKLITAFAALIVIMLAVSGFTYRNLAFIETSSGWAAHTYQVLEALEQMIDGMVNQETGVRGYLVSADSHFLEPYKSGAEQYKGAFAHVKQLTSDNPAQQARLDDANALAQKWQTDIAAKEVQLMVKPETRDEARRLESSGAGKTSMDGFRAKVAEIAKIERDLLVIRNGAQSDAFQLSYMVTIAGGVIALFTVTLLCWLLSRAIATPITGMTRAMEMLAKGDTSIEVPARNRQDEVGQMAVAVQVFKDSAIRMAQLEAEQKEAEQRTAAEREAAAAKMADEFQAAVGGIVEAAVAGDFSKRVSLMGKSGMVLNVGTSINALCENVSKALADLVRMLSALAEGNLTQRITADYQGDFATLKNNANATAERIGSTITEIKQSAREVTNASAEISTSTTDLSQRTEEQAASLEETSASMEEIAVTVKKNAENAQQANESAAKARTVADRGGQVVAKAVDAMAQIEGSSRKISDIIGVIDEIARQTNLLALNAAVEAARAGDAGRGFAVVASEVRSLAQRSSQAAKDIKDLITNSNDQVKDGVELVNQAGSALAEIRESINEVAGVVSGIATASSEQATGIEQVNKALAQMDEVTQQNSALVEENAATAKTLEHQSQAMDQRVAFFRIDESAPAAGWNSTPAASSQLPASKPHVVARPRVAAAPRRSAAVKSAGPVGRMQASLATALKEDPDWKEF